MYLNVRANQNIGAVQVSASERKRGMTRARVFYQHYFAVEKRYSDEYGYLLCCNKAGYWYSVIHIKCKSILVQVTTVGERSKFDVVNVICFVLTLVSRAWCCQRFIWKVHTGSSLDLSQLSIKNRIKNRYNKTIHVLNYNLHFDETVVALRFPCNTILIEQWIDLFQWAISI